MWWILLLIVIGSTVLWPLNRWAMHNQARPEFIGIAISLIGIPLAIIAAVITKTSLISLSAWSFGAVAGVAYAVGFILIIFTCLRIGPTGLTAAANNLGLVWPVVIGMIWYTHGRPVVLQWVGLLCTAVALILMGLSQQAGKAESISKRWATLVLIGWAFSGLSMSCQFLNSQYANAANAPYSFLLGMYAVTLIILLAVILHKRSGRPTRVEILAGAGTTLLNVVSIPVAIWVLTQMPAAIFYPVTVAGPVVLMMLIGVLLLKEHPSPAGWGAGCLGVAGIVLLTLAK